MCSIQVATRAQRLVCVQRHSHNNVRGPADADMQHAKRDFQGYENHHVRAGHQLQLHMT